MKMRVVSVAVLALLAVTAMVVYWKRGETATAAVPGSSKPAPAAPTRSEAPHESVDLHSAVEQSLIKAEFRGNGREKLRATLTNSGQVPLRVQADAGLTFESGQNAIIVVRPKVVELSAGETVELLLQTCATRSTNRVSEMTYKVAYTKISKLEPLLAYAAEHPELSAAALQTAALALVENLPLSAVAKFTPAAAELKSRFNTDAFRVETIDLVAALSAPRASRGPEPE